MTDKLIGIDDPQTSTLCHCASCEAYRKDIRKGLMEFPTEAKESTIAKWLNIKLADMKRNCSNVRDE